MNSLSYSDKYVRYPRKKKARTGVLCSNKGPQKSVYKHHGNQRYFVLCKKSGMPEQKYMLHISEDCMGQRTNQTIKDEMGILVGSRDDTLKQYHKSDNKWKKELKYHRKQNKILYSITKKSGSRCETSNIKKIRAKFSRKSWDSNIDSSSDDLDSDSSMAIYSRGDKYRWPAIRK